MPQPAMSVEMLPASNGFATQPPASAVQGQDRMRSMMPTDSSKSFSNQLLLARNFFTWYGDLLGCDLTSVENYSLQSKLKKYFGEPNKIRTHPLSRRIFSWILHSRNETNGIKWRHIYTCSHSFICEDGSGGENSFMCSQRSA